MAPSAETRALTEAHRQAQLAIRAKTMRDSIAVMHHWTPGDKASGASMIDSLSTLTIDRHNQSAGVALQYLQRFRSAAGVRGTAKLVIPVLTKSDIVPSLYVTTFTFVGNAMRAGLSPQAAKQNTLVTGSGSTGRLALSGGRQAITRTTAKDRAGWTRVLSGDGCPFCQMLADRGAVYGEDSVDFEAHDHCGCTAEPDYS